MLKTDFIQFFADIQPLLLGNAAAEY